MITNYREVVDAELAKRGTGKAKLTVPETARTFASHSDVEVGHYVLRPEAKKAAARAKRKRNARL